MRQQQKRLARAIAMVDDAPELLSELQKRRTRIGYIEAKLAEVERSPGEVSEQMAKIEATARERLDRLDQVMADDRAGLREVFLALFPEGLTFRPYQKENRQVWAISGSANLGGFNLRGDPNGNSWELKAEIPFDFSWLKYRDDRFMPSEPPFSGDPGQIALTVPRELKARK